MQNAGQREFRQRLVFAREFLNFFERVSAALEEFLRSTSRDVDGDGLSSSLLQRGIGERDTGLRRSASAAAFASSLSRRAASVRTHGTRRAGPLRIVGASAIAR